MTHATKKDADPQGGARATGDAAPAKKKERTLDEPIAWLERAQDARADRRAARALPAQRARSTTEKVLTRGTSGAIYAIVTIVALALGPFATTVLVMGEAWLCCSEFFRICRMGGRMPNEVIGLGAALLFPLAAYTRSLAALSLVVFLLLIAVACWDVMTPRANLADVAVTVFGPLYTSLTFSSIVLIRNGIDGWEGGIVTFCVMASIWLNDAGAYLVGSLFGRHKFAPKISPKKTWEGFVGGIVVSVVVWLGLCLLIPDFSVWLAVVTGLVVGLAAVLGDLFESRIKRGVGVKDSGNFMPGHGGLLDRSDSMLFGAMAAWFILRFGGIL